MFHTATCAQVQATSAGIQGWSTADVHNLSKTPVGEGASDIVTPTRSGTNNAEAGGSGVDPSDKPRYSADSSDDDQPMTSAYQRIR